MQIRSVLGQRRWIESCASWLPPSNDAHRGGAVCHNLVRFFDRSIVRPHESAPVVDSAAYAHSHTTELARVLLEVEGTELVVDRQLLFCV